ncbi:hypothetical protein [Corynebacterium sp. H130]|uniref:hypothetical protein n=1 Tax=Corynebacterium sp. H130 TaxID=3133444 RepID=UPI003095DCB6
MRHHFLVRDLWARTETVRYVLFEQALIDCLVDIRDGAHAWWVPAVEGLSPKQVMSIQLIDAFRNIQKVSKARLLAAAHHRFDREVLEDYWRQSCANAQSPWETILRLTIRDLAQWTPQQPFHDATGYQYTVADFVSTRHRVAAFYDGHHHNEPAQIAHDKLVDQKLLEAGWYPFRVTKEQLKDARALRRRLANILNRRN